jgi:hypothetical protein
MSTQEPAMPNLCWQFWQTLASSGLATPHFGQFFMESPFSGFIPTTVSGYFSLPGWRPGFFYGTWTAIIVCI